MTREVSLFSNLPLAIKFYSALLFQRVLGSSRKAWKKALRYVGDYCNDGEVTYAMVKPIMMMALVIMLMTSMSMMLTSMTVMRSMTKMTSIKTMMITIMTSWHL